MMALPLLSIFFTDPVALILAGAGLVCLAYWSALAWGIWAGTAAIVGALS